MPGPATDELVAKMIGRLSARIDQQSDSISLLLEHLSHHHDELSQRTAEECTWLQKRWKGTRMIDDHEVRILIHSTWMDVRDELTDAIAKHGIERTPLNPDMDRRDAFICIAEETGELAHELTYDAGSSGRGGKERTPEEVMIDAEKEAIQVAAMAIAFVVGSRRAGLPK